MKLNPSVEARRRSGLIAELLAESLERLWRCRTFAQKGRFLPTHIEVDATIGIGWPPAREAWLIFGERRAARVASVSSKQTEAG
jgi:hypothetical protein